MFVPAVGVQKFTSSSCIGLPRPTDEMECVRSLCAHVGAVREAASTPST